jgi:hypothetical protein
MHDPVRRTGDPTQVQLRNPARQTVQQRGQQRLVPLAPAAPPRRLGLLAGQVRVGEAFDAPLPDELARAFGA